MAKELLAAGNEVVALKRKSSSLHRIESIISKIDFFDIEELDFDQLFCDCGKIDTIIHTATCYGRNNESVTEIFAANTEFPLRLLDAGKRAGVEVFLNTDTILDKYLNLYALSKNQLLQWGKFFSIHEKMRFANIRLEHFYAAFSASSRFSNTLSCSNTVGFWNLRPTPISAISFSRRRSRSMFWPKDTLPASGRVLPVITSIMVVLPAPLGPMMQRSSPTLIKSARA